MKILDKQSLTAVLLDVDPGVFVSRYIFEPVPYVFGDNLSLWISWKTKLGSLLRIDPYEVVLTGSAATGISLNPSNGCRLFNPESDVDVGIVSAHYFDISWRYLREQRPEWLSLPKKMQSAISSHRTNYVFCGTIATDKILSLLPFGRPWQRALDEMAKNEPTVGRDVKIRIYRDYSALRSYHAKNVERLRQSLVQPLNDDEPISTETYDGQR